ncbi:heavy-metal-associated domain-containing protein [Halocola ammonii]
MKKTTYIFFALLTFSILACNTEQATENTTSDYELSVKSVSSDSDKSVASISIDGMMCEMACGGKIRKELSQIDGVKLAEIEFNEGEPLDLAVVEFDPAVTDASKLATCVNGIADGLYSVKKVEVVNYSKGASAKEDSDAKKTSYFWEKDFRLPSITIFLPHW